MGTVKSKAQFFFLQIFYVFLSIFVLVPEITTRYTKPVEDIAKIHQDNIYGQENIQAQTVKSDHIRFLLQTNEF